MWIAIAIALSSSHFVTASSNALGVGEAGCGYKRPNVKCEGCMAANGGGCLCIVTACVQTNNECTNAPNAWRDCIKPETSGFIILYVNTKCMKRKACNNSQGIEGGDCVSVCTQSGTDIFFGDDRMIFVQTPTVCKCEGGPA